MPTLDEAKAAFTLVLTLMKCIATHVDFGLSRLEHDPESGNRFSEKIMLKQRDEIMIRFNLIGS